VKVTGTPRRDVRDDEFATITAVPVVGMAWIEGDLVVEFASDLTSDEQDAVRQRMGSRNGNEETLRNQSVQALKNNRDFLAIAAPTQAQTLTQVTRLTRQMNGVLRMLLGELDGTN
jgi:hypothetical protein